jgi:signal peptidase
MSLEDRLSLVVEVVVVLAILALVAGQLLGQPILLSYTTSGSMEPTIGTGDGYVVIPDEVAGPVEEGDVVVFRASEIQGGGLTVHRVVGETERGYITKGDANPFTDQDNAEPPVKEAQIVGVAPQAGGSVVTIPALGAVVTGIQNVLGEVQRLLAAIFGSRSLLGVQGLAYLFFGVTVGWYAVGEWRARGGRDRSPDDRRRDAGVSPHLIAAGFALLLVLGATTAMVAPAGSQEYTVVSADFDSERPTVIPAGESSTVPYSVSNGGVLPVISYLEPASDGIEVSPGRVQVDSRSATTATVTLHAPPETGLYRRYLVEHRYLALLPTSTIDALYRIHPWAPILAIDALIGIPFYLVSLSLVGRRRVRTRSRDGPSTLDRLISRFG